jgi:carboxymethylenebutenolidase
MGKMIEFVRPDGQKAPGYLSLPASHDEAPGVVVVHELWGLAPHIKSVADKLAQDGFRALVPDLYRGKIAKDKDEGRQLMTSLNFSDVAHQDLRGAVQHLKDGSSAKVAVLGFCMGGALTIVAGVTIPELDAGVCFYGIPREGVADPSKIRVPMQFHFATQDEWCNSELVAKLERALTQGSISHELYIYEAKHAFMNDARPEVYAPEAAREAWARAIAFLGTNIRVD